MNTNTKREDILAQFKKFRTWGDVLAHVSNGSRVWYLAPLSYAPALIQVRRGAKRHADQLRVTPYDRDCDPFWADEDHFDRFLVRADSEHYSGHVRD